MHSEMCQQKTTLTLVLKISFRIKHYDLMNCTFSQSKATREVGPNITGRDFLLPE